MRNDISETEIVKLIDMCLAVDFLLIMISICNIACGIYRRMCFMKNMKLWCGSVWITLPVCVGCAHGPRTRYADIVQTSVRTRPGQWTPFRMVSRPLFPQCGTQFGLGLGMSVWTVTEQESGYGLLPGVWTRTSVRMVSKLG